MKKINLILFFILFLYDTNKKMKIRVKKIMNNKFVRLFILTTIIYFSAKQLKLSLILSFLFLALN